MVHREAVDNIRRLRESGLKNREIAKAYEDDPYVKVDRII